MKVTEIYILEVYSEDLILHNGNAIIKVKMRVDYLGREYDIERYYGVYQWDKIKSRGYMYE